MEKKRVVQLVASNPRISVHQGSLEVAERFNKTVSDKTVRRIWKEAENNGRDAHRKPHISKANKIKRMDFAHQHTSKPNSFCNKVIFSDESKFCIFGIKGKKLIWRKR
ncbi:uncharacterized protein Dwil_GK28167 [Drosophila willistoni]|uniref:Transposase Tc1-like domain-containing protein n=1 Tax=Drosophila willistoni TaxID=7260 RepID=A0A0Q9WWK7_DROWI|nr:uncharacterized protein Dwil_GK28167 [Drosophila willistoni]